MDKRKLALNVLMVVSSFPSTEAPNKSPFNLVAAKLLSKGHNLIILRIQAWKPGRKCVENKKFEEFSIIYLSFPLFNFKWFKNITLNHFFLRLVINLVVKRLLDVDVIHSVGGGLNAYAASVISKGINKPFVSQYIGSDVNFYLSKNYAKRTIEKYIESTSYHVFNSNQLLLKFTTLFPSVENKKVIYRGIDLKKIKSKVHDSKDLKILFLGGFVNGDFNEHIDNLKGGVNLLRAWSKLDKNHNLLNIKLFFGGPNSNKYKEYIDISKLNYPASFEVIGEVPKITVEKYMNESNIVIIPSLFEGLPNVAFEALAYGNMIIGTRVGGIPEIVDNKCGILIEPNNEDEIVEAILYAISNPNFIINSAVEGKQKIKKYDSSCYLEGYSEIYKMVIKQRK